MTRLIVQLEFFIVSAAIMVGCSPGSSTQQTQPLLDGRAEITSQVLTDAGFTRTERIDGYDVLLKYRSGREWGAFASALIAAEHAEQAKDVLSFVSLGIGDSLFGPLESRLDRVLENPEYLMVVLRRRAIGNGGCLEMAKGWKNSNRRVESELPVTVSQGIELRGAVASGVHALAATGISRQLASLGAWYVRRDPTGIVLFMLADARGHGAIQQLGRAPGPLVDLVKAVDVMVGEERRHL